MIRIIRALPKDINILVDLEIRSESYWGYSTDFMEKFKELYLITKDFIKNNITYVLIENGKIIGFYGLLTNAEEASLEYLFIEPLYIGKGYGKLLWRHALQEFRQLGIKEFTIITSKDARGFYLKLGATIHSHVDSLISKGNKTPKLIYRLQQ